jgi:hypothetical protein
MSMAGPLGGGAGDPGAPTINRENIDSGPLWEAMSEIQEYSPSMQKNINDGFAGPCGGSDLHPGFKRCVVNLYEYDRQKVILLTGLTFPMIGPVMADDP